MIKAANQAPSTGMRKRLTRRVAWHTFALLSAALLAFSYLAASGGLGRLAYGALVVDSHDQPTGAERIILVPSGGRPRIDEAVSLQRTARLPILVVGADSAVNMKWVKEAGGVGRVLTDASQDTEHDAAFFACSLATAEAATVYLVTDAAHMRRAAAWFEYYGVHVTRRIARDGRGGTSTGSILHEWGGLLEFWIKRAAQHRIECPHSQPRSPR